MEQLSPTRKRGPRRGVNTQKTTIMLPEHLQNWGVDQPGGLSNLVRTLLQEAYDKAAPKTSVQIGRLTTYQVDLRRFAAWGQRASLSDAERRVTEAIITSVVDDPDHDAALALLGRFQAQGDAPEAPPPARVVVSSSRPPILRVGHERFEVDPGQFIAWGKQANLSEQDSKILQHLTEYNQPRPYDHDAALALIRRFRSES